VVIIPTEIQTLQKELINIVYLVTKNVKLAVVRKLINVYLVTMQIIEYLELIKKNVFVKKGLRKY